MGTYGGWLGLLFAVMIAAAFNIETGALYDASLTQRIEADAPITWDVGMNDAQAGTVTDTQYAMMRRHAFRDGRNTMAQLFNVGRMALVVFDKLFIAVPLMFFRAAIALAVFAPDS